MTNKIAFVRFERECGHNKRIREEYAKSATHPRIINDFKVLIDGEHRATFQSEVTLGRGYRLYDADGRALHKTETNYYEHLGQKVEKQADFSGLIDFMLSAGKIPTLAEMAEKRAQEAKADAAEKAAVAEAERIQRIQGAAVELYDALKDLLRNAAISDSWRTKAESALAKAEGS